MSNLVICRERWARVKSWFATDLGQAVLAAEKASVQVQLESCFGYNIVQLGSVSEQSLIEQARIKRKFVIDCSYERVAGTSLQSYFQELAIKNHSIDTVLLYHTLEFEDSPHAILREVERILVPEGKLIIVQFNPYSLWGLWHLHLLIKRRLEKNKSLLPSSGRLISHKRLRDWLSLLGFDIESSQANLFWPPLNNMSILKKMQFMDKVGRQYWPKIGGSRTIIATKRVSTLTPIKPKWTISKKVLGSRLSEPSTHQGLKPSKSIKK